MRKTNSLLPNVTLRWMGLLLNMASLSYQIDGNQDFGQHSRTGIATFIRAPEQFYGSRDILTGTNILQQKEVHSNELSNIVENKSFDDELNIVVKAAENRCPEINEKHDLLYLLLTACNDKKSMSQNAVSSALFEVDIPDSEKKQSKKYLRVEEAEDANSDTTKVQQNDVAYPIHLKTTYDVEHRSEYAEPTEATSMVHDNIMKKASKKLEYNKKGTFEKYAPLLSVIQNTLRGALVLEDSQVNSNRKQEDFTVSNRWFTSAPTDKQNVFLSKPLIEIDNAEKRLKQKVIIRNFAIDQGSITFDGIFKGIGEKRKQAETLLETNEHLRTKEINCKSECSARILSKGCNERQTAESIAGFKSKHVGEHSDISRMNFNAKFKKYYLPAELLSFLSGSAVVPKTVQVINEIPLQKFVKGERIRRRNGRSNLRNVGKVNDKFVSRFFRTKFQNGPSMFERRFTRSMNEDMKSKGAPLNSLREYRRSAFALPDTIDEKVHLLRRKISTINDYHRELIQDDLNTFLHRMEMLANHIDKLHERYLRYNELNDDYISEELPSEYFKK